MKNIMAAVSQVLEPFKCEDDKSFVLDYIAFAVVHNSEHLKAQIAGNADQISVETLEETLVAFTNICASSGKHIPERLRKLIKK